MTSSNEAERILSMVLDGVTSQNAPELCLAALLLRTKHQEGNEDIANAAGAVILKALESEVKTSEEVQMTLEYLRFEGSGKEGLEGLEGCQDLQNGASQGLLSNLPLSTLRHLATLQLERGEKWRFFAQDLQTLFLGTCVSTSARRIFWFIQVLCKQIDKKIGLKWICLNLSWLLRSANQMKLRQGDTTDNQKHWKHSKSDAKKLGLL